ncbi:MAG: hypothetical protein ABW133_12565 [Polyangiaceae bacterium]
MVKTNNAAPAVRRRSKSTSVSARAAIWLVALASLLIANWVWAASGRAVNVVLLIEGADVELVRRDVTDVLPPRFNLVEADSTKAALSKEGVMGSFADALSNQRVRKQALAGVHKSLKQEGVPALIAVRTRKGRNGARETRVVLVMSEQTEPVVEEDMTLGKNEKLGRKIGPLLAVPLEDIEASNEKAVAAAPKSAPPAAAAPPPEKAAPAPVAEKPSKKKPAAEPAEPAPEKEKDEAPIKAEVAASSEDASRDSGPRKKRDKTDFNNGMIILDAGLEVGARKLSYSDPLVGPLRSYLAPGVAGYGFGAQFYPAASTGTPFAKDIAIVGRYSGSLGFESQTKDGSQKATGSWTRMALGVRGRVLAGPKATGPYLGFEGTYGQWDFVFEGADAIVQEVPSVRYRYLRGGFDAKFPFNAFSLTAGVGGMYVMSAGEFSDRFPHASIAGVDGWVRAAYAFLPWLEARGEASYNRIFSSAKPERGDAYIAGGALDEYFIFHGGVAAVF